MKNIYLIIEIHQPMKLRTYRFFEIMNNHYYYDDFENEFIIMKASEKAYMPANEILHKMVDKYEKNFRFTFLFSGVVLDQFELYAPEMVKNYRSLTNTGHVDLLNGTYSNSLGFPDWSLSNDQLTLQRDRLISLFGLSPVSIPDRRFLNNGLSRNGIKVYSENTKFNGIFTNCFSYRQLCNWTSASGRLVDSLNEKTENAGPIIIFIPYNLSGDYQNVNIEISGFLESFISAILSKTEYKFVNPSGEPGYSIPQLPESLQYPDDHNYELPFASLFNPLQLDAMEKLHSFTDLAGSCTDKKIRQDWLYLQSGDHFYNMDQAIYEEQVLYRNSLHYDSAYFAYINYMNILLDFGNRLGKTPENFKLRSRSSYTNIA